MAKMEWLGVFKEVAEVVVTTSLVAGYLGFESYIEQVRQGFYKPIVYADASAIVVGLSTGAEAKSVENLLLQMYEPRGKIGFKAGEFYSINREIDFKGGFCLR
jgi:hypothetical protein